MTDGARSAIAPGAPKTGLIAASFAPKGPTAERGRWVAPSSVPKTHGHDAEIRPPAPFLPPFSGLHAWQVRRRAHRVRRAVRPSVGTSSRGFGAVIPLAGSSFGLITAVVSPLRGGCRGTECCPFLQHLSLPVGACGERNMPFFSSFFSIKRQGRNSDLASNSYSTHSFIQNGPSQTSSDLRKL